MERPEALTSGELNAAITREVVRIHTASLGRGPQKSFSFHNGNVIVTVLHDAMFPAERTLIENEDMNAVRSMRVGLHHAMEQELKAGVEELAGREVLAIMSDSHADPDLVVNVFVLDRPIG